MEKDGNGGSVYISNDKKARLDSSNVGGASGPSGPSKELPKEKRAELESQYSSSNSSMPINSGESNGNSKMNPAGEKRGLSQSKNGDNGNKPQQKRKIKAPNNYNKTKIGAIGGMAKSAGNALLKGALKTAKYTGKKVGRGAIRTVAAFPGALLGGAMSIATGDTSYLAAGVGAGALLGGKVADAMGRAPKAVRSAYRQERLGAQGAAGKERYEEFKKNKDNMNYLKEEYGLNTKQAKVMIEQGKDFIEAGYTNPEDVYRLTKMQDEFKDATSDQIMAADQMASSYGADYFMDDKKLANLEDNSTYKIMAEASKRGQTMDESTARKMAQKHINVMASSKGLSQINFEERKAKVATAKAQEKADKDLDRQYKKAMIEQSKASGRSRSKRTSTRTSSKTTSNDTKRRRKDGK